MMLGIALFIFGLVLLLKGADFLIEGSQSIAERFNISDLVIGLTIVSFGTSLPELIVSVFASLNGSTDLLIGNIFGSNISNILLIAGSAAIVSKITIGHGTVWKEIPFSLLAALVVAILANDILIDGTSVSQLSKSDGLILLSFFAIFLYYVYGITKNTAENQEKTKPKYSPYTSIAYILAGIICLFLGGQWVVAGALTIADYFQISESIVGLTILAIGTSLPELTTSVVAALKKNADIAVGNVVGSNIFNLFLVLGVSALINPVHFVAERNLDILMVIIASVLFFLAANTGKEKMTLERHEGVFFLLIYFGYLAFLIINSGAI